MIAALVLIAIVVQDQTPLRAAPRDTALQQAVLWQGDTLEVRGERLDYLQVYDHRRERAGYVRTWQVRTYPLDPSSASELLAVARFLHDTPGAEALGIGYVALFLKAAPAEAISAEVFDALGTMADRLARRSSVRRGKPGDEALAAHLEVAANYGITFHSFEREERVQVCYDGDAFRHVLALPATDEQHARAALALTRPECVNPTLGPVELHALDKWRAEVLDRVELAKLPGFLANRIRLRRAGVWASLAFQLVRRDEPPQKAGMRALEELAGVSKTELAQDDTSAYTEAAVRVGASRWAAESLTPPTAGLSIVTAPRQPGETCVKLVDAQHTVQTPLFERCTYGTVWAASARAAPRENALALAVQPLDTWRELWIFRRTDTGWAVDMLTPATTGPDLGYIEFAGWVPDGSRVLAAREVRVDGKFKRSFEILRLDTLEVEQQAESPNALTPFYRWQAPDWKRQTLAVR
ncbi:MAG TPA: hypothetical protein VGX03_22085 [Candidatus Binatia bacterium]|nr:hypothetical protein [Candidatus Binatia bacterium]